jgi:hypothetical protein
MTTATSRNSSVEAGFGHIHMMSVQTHKPQLEYVMVEDPKTYGSANTVPHLLSSQQVEFLPTQCLHPPHAVSSADGAFY